LALAIALCSYWLAFDVYVARTPNLQRPDFRDLTDQLGPPKRPRAIVTWTLAADSVQFYLGGSSRRVFWGPTPICAIDVVSKPIVAGRPPGLPPRFRPTERRRLGRLTLTRYMAKRIYRVPFHVLAGIRTGFGRNAVVADGISRRRGRCS
jgi:hypothetical protein